MEWIKMTQTIVVEHGGRATSEKSRTVALILCLIGFVGIAGLHELYVGKTLMAILYFLTLGFFFIGTIISLLAILLGNFKDGNWAVVRTW